MSRTHCSRRVALLRLVPSLSLPRLALIVLVSAAAAACSEPSAPLSRQPGVEADVTAGDGPAGLALSDAAAALVQTTRTAWTLDKTGSVDASAGTVTWTITATQGATTAGQLIVDGSIVLTNPGSGDAALGNIVVNLQARSDNAWVTLASDIADATHGDAATTARVDPHGNSEDLSSFTETAASGELELEDASSNTTFSLVPQKTIAPNESLSLLFAASYDNTVLALPVGTVVRAEVLVSFGNASPHGPTAHDVDINGNGSIDDGEADVRTVPARIAATVPAQQSGSSTLTLSDTEDEITTTGTVTVFNPSFDLGATGGTVTVHFDGGTDGGTIRNCAHLTGGGSSGNIGGVDLESCDTQTVAATRTCIPGTPGCPWQNGDLQSYDQASWGSTPGGGNAAELLADNFAPVYASTNGLLELGIPGTGGYSIVFTSASAIRAYLPASGLPGVFDADLLDPSTTAAGYFGGDVLALRLDVDFSDAGVLPGTSGLAYGDLTLCGLTTTPSFNGMTVRQVLDIVSNTLGGGTAPYSIADLDDLVTQLTGAFGFGPSQFAQDHIVNGACPAWQDGDVVTYFQDDWTTDPAATMFYNHFNQVYAATGFLEVGISGSGGFSILFSDAQAVLDYLPTSGDPGVLNTDLLDPTTSSSGAFGGAVVALRLNVDYSDAGVLTGNANVAFGDLTLCNFTDLPALDGMTVREFEHMVETLLGGGTASYPLSDLYPLTAGLNGSFATGATAFAQIHLFNGACP